MNICWIMRLRYIEFRVYMYFYNTTTISYQDHLRSYMIFVIGNSKLENVLLFNAVTLLMEINLLYGFLRAVNVSKVTVKRKVQTRRVLTRLVHV